MAVSFVAVSVITGDQAATGNVSPAVPAGIAADDILVLIALSRDNVTHSVSGWTQVVQVSPDSTNQFSIWWKRTTGSESAPTVVHADGDVIIACILAARGVPSSLSDPFSAVGTPQLNGATSPVSTTAVSAYADDLIVHVLASDWHNSASSWTGTPTTEQFDDTSWNGNQCGLALATGSLGSTGTTGAGGVSLSSTLTGSVSVQFALAAAVPGEDRSGTANTISATATLGIVTGHQPGTMDPLEAAGSLGSAVGTRAVAGNAATLSASATLGVAYASVPIVRLQVGQPTYGSGTTSPIADDGYQYGYSWRPQGTAPRYVANDWVAINLGSGPSQLLANWSDELAGDFHPLSGAGLTDYRIQTSSDSTDGSDGTWTTAVTVTGNDTTSRAHLIDFAGQSWVKLIVDGSSSNAAGIDELDCWNASGGTADSFIFLGDSIVDSWNKRATDTAITTRPSIQDLIYSRHGVYPLQIGGGDAGIGVLDILNNIDAYLARWPMVKYWGIQVGTNDAYNDPTGANVSTYSTRLTAVVEAILADGRIPILSQIPYSTDASFHAEYYPPYNEAIDAITATYGLIAGPDPYTYFESHQSELTTEGGDGTHPGRTGVKSFALMWADVISAAVYSTRSGTASLSASAALGVTSGSRAVSGSSAALAASAELSTTDGTRASSGAGEALSGTAELGLVAGTKAASNFGASLSGVATLGLADGASAGGDTRSGTSQALMGAATLSSADGTRSVGGTAAVLGGAASLGAPTSSRAVTGSAQALAGAAALSPLQGYAGGPLEPVGADVADLEDLLALAELRRAPASESLTFAPAWTGLAEVGDVTKTGEIVTVGDLVVLTATIESAGGTSAAVAGSTYLDLPVPERAPAVASVADVTALAGLTSGVVTAGRLYAPTWSATADTIVITATYRRA